MEPDADRLADPETTWTSRSPAAVSVADADRDAVPDVITLEEAVRPPVAVSAAAPPVTTVPAVTSVPEAFRAALARWITEPAAVRDAEADSTELPGRITDPTAVSAAEAVSAAAATWRTEPETTTEPEAVSAATPAWDTEAAAAREPEEVKAAAPVTVAGPPPAVVPISAPNHAFRLSDPVAVPVTLPVVPAVAHGMSADETLPFPMSMRSVKPVGGVHDPPPQLVAAQIKSRSGPRDVTLTAGETLLFVSSDALAVGESNGLPDAITSRYRIARPSRCREPDQVNAYVPVSAPVRRL
jgi:hypothetical protein